jgi:nitrogen fixation protein FixH
MTAAIRRWTGRTVLFWAIGIFGVVAAANAVMITSALRSFPGEDVTNPWLQGQAMARARASASAAAALGWRAQVTLAGPQAAPHLEGRVTDAQGRPLTGIVLKGALRRPATDRMDQPIEAIVGPEGRIAVPLQPLARGRWTLRATLVGAAGQVPVEAEFLW